MLKDNIEVKIAENTQDGNLVVSANYWNFLYPFNEEEKKAKEEVFSKFSNLSKEEVEKLLVTHQEQEEMKKEEIKQMMLNLTEEVVQRKFLEQELVIIKKIDAIKEFFDTKEDTFNKENKVKEEQSIEVSITNGIYLLTISARKSYKKNYTIRGYLTLNPNFKKSSSNTIESFENQSYSDISKVETYINNKLKKYNHLFVLKKAILAKDVKSKNIHPRIIKELEIEVFESPADILSKVDK